MSVPNPSDPSQSAEEDEKLVGLTFEGRYRLEGRLATGGMGSVFRATQLSVGRTVALKVLRGDRPHHVNAQARFEREARAVAALAHPNIVQLIDFGRSEAHGLYLVMEYLDGEPLSTWIAREAPIPPERVQHVARQALDALGAAHQANIVHRDLKPENVIRVSRGLDPDFIKLVDFGIAKATGLEGDGVADSSITRAGAIIGSPRYMSPEQARSQPAVPQTDLYALALMLHEMLTGRPVFREANTADYLIAHVAKRPERPRVGRQLFVGPFVDALMACLAKRPEERPASAHELLVRLRGLPEPTVWVDIATVTPPEDVRGAIPPAPTPEPGVTQTIDEPVESARTRRLELATAPGSGAPARRLPARTLALAAIALVLAGVSLAVGWGDDPREAAPGAPPARMASVPRDAGRTLAEPDAAAVRAEEPAPARVPEVAPLEGAAAGPHLVVVVDSRPQGALVQVEGEEVPRGTTPVAIQWPATAPAPTVQVTLKGHRETSVALSPTEPRTTVELVPLAGKRVTPVKLPETPATPPPKVEPVDHEPPERPPIDRLPPP